MSSSPSQCEVPVNAPIFKPFVCVILSSNHARQKVFGYHSRLALAACTSTRPAKANASRLHEHIVHFTVLLKCISQSFLSSSPWHYRTRTSEIVHLRISFDQNHCCEWIRNENSLAVSTVTIGTALIGHTILQSIRYLCPVRFPTIPFYFFEGP